MTRDYSGFTDTMMPQRADEDLYKSMSVPALAQYNELNGVKPLMPCAPEKPTDENKIIPTAKKTPYGEVKMLFCNHPLRTTIIGAMMVFCLLLGGLMRGLVNAQDNKPTPQTTYKSGAYFSATSPAAFSWNKQRGIRNVSTLPFNQRWPNQLENDRAMIAFPDAVLKRSVAEFSQALYRVSDGIFLFFLALWPCGFFCRH